MEIVVHYRATIPRVQQFTRAGQTVFVTTRWVEGKEGTEQRWDEKPLDAFSVREEFLKVKTERQALDFLRNTGEFLPHGDDLSWSDFQLWQRYAELVLEREKLSKVHKAVMANQPTDDLDPNGEINQMLLMLTGLYDHTYFGGSSRPLSPEELENVRHAAEVMSETPQQAADDYQDMLADIRSGAALIRQSQRELEHWFYAPPRQAYSIEFIPEKLDAELRQNMQRGGALLDYLHPHESLTPILLIKADCALKAIAATIYADRIAGIRFRECPGCKTLFKIGSQKAKKYCDDDRCKARKKKKDQRDRRKKPAEDTALKTEVKHNG